MSDYMERVTIEVEEYLEIACAILGPDSEKTQLQVIVLALLIELTGIKNT